MKQSSIFWNPLKESKAQIHSHALMLRANLITNLASGLYAWQPMGLRVLRKVEDIIRKHMKVCCAQELLIPVMQPAELWKKSGRYDAYGKEMLRMKDRHDKELIYGPTAEECVSYIFDHAKVSYKDMPVSLYNIQWKFRDEIRPRFGVMRSREFLMKDAYSFDLTHNHALETYENMFNAYVDIFSEIFDGTKVKVQPVIAEGGAVGGTLTHEFNIIAKTGENKLFLDKKWKDIDKPTLLDANQLYARSGETHNDQTRELDQQTGIEVGHIFLLGTKYSESMNIKIQTPQGFIYPFMGCYGIGVTRLVAAIIEASSDEKGIIWPKAVAPFDIHLINVNPNCEKCIAMCDEIYNQHHMQNPESILYDDTKNSAGVKLNNADLLGIPTQIIVGTKEVENGAATIKYRA